MALVRGTSLSRTIRITPKGLAAISGSLALFRGPCIGCRASVTATRFGAFDNGGQRHSARQCDALTGRRAGAA